MRLIDADKLHLPPEDIGSRMAVAYAPTAYDVDNVISELQNVAYCKNIPTYDHPYSSGSVIDEDDAIDIVKRGGLRGKTDD